MDTALAPAVAPRTTTLVGRRPLTTDVAAVAGPSVVSDAALVEGPLGFAPVLSLVRGDEHGTTVMFGARSLQDLVVHRPEDVRGMPLAAVREHIGAAATGAGGARLWYVAGDTKVRAATLSILHRAGISINEPGA